MSLSEKHASFCWTADVVMVPLVGTSFILCSALVAFLGRVTFNGTRVSYAEEPLKFASLVGGGVAIGLLCIGFGVLRFVLGRRRGRNA